MDQKKHTTVALFLGCLLNFITAQTAGSPPTISVFTINSPLMENNMLVSGPVISGASPDDIAYYKDGVEVGRGTTLRKQVNISRAGYYWVIANNSLGAVISEKKRLDIYHLEPWTDSDTNETLSVEEGGHVLINLPPIDSYPEISSSTPDSVKWYKNDTLLAPNAINYHISKSKQLAILDVPSSLNGQKLHAEFMNLYVGASTTSRSFKLDVSGTYTGGLSFVISLPEKTFSKSGGPLFLECVASVSPVSSVTMKWYKKPSSGARTLVTSNENFGRSIIVWSLANGDIYECEASASGHSTISSSTTISILADPTFLNRMNSEYEVDLKSELHLPCNVIGVPTPNITWYRNAVPLQSGNRMLLSPNGTLVLYNIELSDSGVYQCVASDGENSARDQTYVKLISSPPVIKESFNNMTDVEGSETQLKCVVDGKPVPEINWIFKSSIDGHTTNLGNGGRFTLNAQGLTIRPTQWIDSGLYTCKANNSLGIAETSASLSIYNRTRIKSNVLDYPIEEERGSTVTRACTLEKDNRVAATILWYLNQKGTESLIENTSYRALKNNNQTLQLSGLEYLRDQGLYTCKLTSSAGDDTRTYNITVVEIPRKPEVHAELATATKRAILITWNAPYNGNKPITGYNIRYKEDDGQFKNLTGARGLAPDKVSFLAEGLSPSRTYRFVVTAINSLGEGQWSEPTTAIKIPTEPPSAPPLFVDSIESVDPNTLKVRWTSPPKEAWNGDLLGYKIRYRLGRSSNPIKTLTHDIDPDNSQSIVYNQLIDGLEPYTEYWIDIAAFNEKGPGVYTELQRATTGEGKPDSPPLIQTVQATSSTACKITWERPESPTIHGQTKGYKLKAHKGLESGPSRNLTVPHTQDGLQEAVMDGLEKYTFYRISVLLYTDGGESPEAWANCTTDQDIPEQVASFNVTQRTHNSISVVWKPPKVTNGIITKYKLTATGGGNDTLQMIAGNETTATIENLKAETAYSLRVQAGTVKGLGPVYEITDSTRPPPKKPSPPSKVEERDVSPRSVVLRFEPGDDGQAPVTNWIVESRLTPPPIDLDDGGWKFNSNITDTLGSQVGVPKEIAVNQLKPYTIYYFRVKALNIAGMSDPSLPTSAVRTKAAPPEHPPLNISMRAHNYSALIINWEALRPEEFNGADGGYLVRYTSNRGSSDVNVTNSQSRFFILGGLSPYTEYSVMMSATNSLYESNKSQAVTARTIEYVPSRAPEFTTKAAVSPSVINLNWNKLNEKDANGIILGYKIMYQPSDGNRADMKTIEVSEGDITSASLTDLAGFTQYNIQILAYTRIGDGQPSPVSVVRTSAGISSPPQAFTAQNIVGSSLTLVWQQPKHPNTDKPLTYSLIYEGISADYNKAETNGITSTYYNVAGLRADTRYKFALTAVNDIGVSAPTVIEVKTIPASAQNVPPKPEAFRVVSQSSTTVTTSWNPSPNADLPVRNYTLWVKKEGDSSYTQSDLYIPSASLTAELKDLTPNTQYSLKLTAVNDKGHSMESDEEVVRTNTDVPSQSPSDFVVIPKSPDTLNLTWKIPSENFWNGDLISTRIWYTLYNPTGTFQIERFDHKDVSHPTTTALLSQLTAGKTYEIRLSSMNLAGYSFPSAPQIVYVGVAVPIGSPSDVNTTMLSDTEILVKWEPLSADEINGQLLGYKVYYEALKPTSRRNRRAGQDIQVDLVAPEASSHVIKNLKIYTEYSIEVAAYNIAGEGPHSKSITAITDQGLPGPPANLQCSELTLNRVNISWEIPLEPNGNITGFIINHFIVGERRDLVSSLHHVAYPQTHDVIKLEKNTTYNVSVQAITNKGEGTPITVVYRTGPHSGVPGVPDDAQYSKDESGIIVSWSKGSDGNAAIQGYVIEGLGGQEWEFVVREYGPEAEKKLLETNEYKSLESYSRFKVSLYNSYGLGEAMEADETVPFYKTWWFLVIIALVALVIIIIIVAVLCCYCYRTKAKLAEEAYENDVLGVDNSQYNTYEMRQSFKRDSRRGSKYREPPRPSPGAVLYGNDEAPPRYDDSSSVTEKGDLTSDDDDDTKGKLSCTDSSDDDMDKTGASSVTPSYNNYQYGGHNHYVSSGAVQQSWQNSFKRARNGGGRNMYSYTDSEAESTAAGPSTSNYYSRQPRTNNYPYNNHNSSRQHLVLSPPDTPGSRAPLPNFSSFV